ncbi:sporulation-delaying protein SdpB family protein [Streptomyces sp. TRM 70361]|uniref:sporulation-delaying protein SdpB family protein n=1 Tax=Streptomyces sp. TRM 70361 TaxID=3116553 RepID=UPI002E7BF2D8|nr:sporulation-delaying protein SdpB family protein [Streptomyces sp. TRM 70361]MEE1942656.1 sporulation-delaying protein SdpB family protein [Streptomyces sp. TRM 70361]
MSSRRHIVLPWTNVYGLARTLVALGTAGTLVASSAETLFRPVATLGDYPPCTSTAAAGVFCLAPDDHTRLTWIMWGCVAVLLVVASGWRPRLTALPHAYVNYSVFSGISIIDGGDQIALVLSVLFVLPALGDGRRWHWQQPPDRGTGPSSGALPALIGVSGLVMVRVQMTVLYFQAAAAKLPHAEWQDGTAMWYWGSHLEFGPAPWLDTLVAPVITAPLGVALLTWVPLVIEFSLAVSLLLPQRVRWWVMGAGLSFHLSIAVMMGLWSFALAMAGGIVVLCAPLGSSFRLRFIRRTGPDGEPSPRSAEKGREKENGRETEAEREEEAVAAAPARRSVPVPADAEPVAGDTAAARRAVAEP